VNNADRNAIPTEEIRAELERALASPMFSSADRASRFLRFIVERHIEGQANALKEYSIALDVFDRDHSYDPKVDAIVRVEAGRLRNRLARFYTADPSSAIRIDLPKGSYVPVFQRVSASDGAAAEDEIAPDPGRHSGFSLRRWVSFAFLLCTVAASILVGRKPAEIPQPRMTQLTADEGLTAFPAISPDKRILAYASDRAGEGNLDIWAQQLAGSSPIRLTHDPADDYDPALSPDGSLIAFRSDRDAGGIYTVPILGGQEQLIASGGRNPKFSPDGKSLAYWVGLDRAALGVRPGSARIYVLSWKDRMPRQLAAGFATAARPVWSPDSQRLLFLGQSSADQSFQWWETTVEGGHVSGTNTLNRVRQHQLSSPYWPMVGLAPEQWLADGRIRFSAGRGDSLNTWEIPIRGSAPPRPVTAGTAMLIQQSASADGTTVFASAARNVDLWSLPVARESAPVRSDLKKVTTDGTMVTFPSVSRDGKIAAFSRQRTPAQGIWIKDFVSGTERQLSSAADGRDAPMLSPDGTRIAWVAKQDSHIRTFVSLLNGSEAKAVCDECRPWGFASSTPRLLHGPYGLFAEYARVLDLDTGQAWELVRETGVEVLGFNAAPDDRSFAFQAIRQGKSKVYIAPFPPAGQTAPYSAWMPVTDDGSYSSHPRWSADGKLLYFVSDLDGFPCLWAQKLSSGTRRPDGQPFAVRHFHSAAQSLRNITLAHFDLAVASDRILLNIGTVSGNIWMLQ
jgi:Tol biopolymer transport system component